MKFTPLAIQGIMEITLDRLGDDRGFFARTFCMEEFAKAGLQTVWTQMNTSFTATAGTLRGMHFQRAPMTDAKLIRATQGDVYDVAVDLRAHSPTFGQTCAVTLSATSGNAVYIPQGCAHGFQTLTADVVLHYCHSENYAPDHEGGVNARDPALGIDWPLPVGEMSARDRALPALTEVTPL